MKRPSSMDRLLSVRHSGFRCEAAAHGGVALLFAAFLTLPAQAATVDRRIAASGNDAEESLTTAVVSITSADLEMVDNGGVQQLVGLRFPSIPLSNRDYVTRAYIQFTTRDTANVDSGILTVQGEASDNAVAFSGSARISARPRTSAAVAWDPPAWLTLGEAGIGQRTNDVSAIVQEIIGRSGWRANGALAFVVSGSTGYRRNAWQFDGNPAGAPVLHIEYQCAYYGNLHNHSSYSDGAGLPADHFADARRSGLDFLGVSDHANDMSPAEWTALKSTATQASVDGQFVAFHGFEWGTIGDYTVINTSEMTTTTATATNTFAGLMSWLSTRSGVAFQNHPGGAATATICANFNTAAPKLVGMELWNKTAGFETYYDRGGCDATDGGKTFFDEALQRTWRMGATGSRDIHAEFIVSSTSRNYVGGSYPYRIGIWAGSLTKQALFSSLESRRFFSTMDPTLRLWFAVSGVPMGGTVGPGSRTARIWMIDPELTERFTSVELVKGNRTGAALRIVNLGSPNSRSALLSAPITANRGDYFYVRVRQADGGRAISSPVWIQ